jgi:hypothetical protein
MLANGTTLQSAIPGTTNAKMIAASAITPDCQQNLIAVRIPVFSQVEALAIQGKVLRTCSDRVDVYECI